MDFTPNWSVLAAIGYREFHARGATVDDNYWVHFSANARYSLLSGDWKPYLIAGPGAYVPLNGSSQLGVNAGLGVDYTVHEFFTIGLGAEYHHLFAERAGFLTAHGAAAIQF